MCGERRLCTEAPLLEDGSSPRVRGTERRRRVFVVGYRFIPACAGNGSHARVIRPLQTVHPRVCGERGKSAVFVRLPTGSSPRVRGTVGQHHPVTYIDRFIPACAGNGPGDYPMAGQRAVHPRVCGERRFKLLKDRMSAGSSPRVRGTEVSKLGHLKSGRFIPACAGNGVT